MISDQLSFKAFKQKYESGAVSLNRHTFSMLNSDSYKNFILSYIERIQSDLWMVEDECEFALVLSYYRLEPKLNLPDNLTYPTRIYFRERDIGEGEGVERSFDVVLLDHTIELVGGLSEAKKIVSKKPKGAKAYTPNYHRYQGYIFNEEWIEAEKNKPYELRIKCATIKDLTKAIYLQGCNNENRAK